MYIRDDLMRSSLILWIVHAMQIAMDIQKIVSSENE